MLVGLVHNRATEELLRESPELTLNLCDSVETIEAVIEALEAGGHSVVPVLVDKHLPVTLAGSHFDIVFNISAGFFYGESRQAAIPAMLDYLNIPYTGGGLLAETLAHHKHIMKDLLLRRGLPTPAFQMFQHEGEPLRSDLRFPLIVKLPSEGGSLGLDLDSVVDHEAALREQVAWMLNKYQQGALVEEYIEGREFTVPVLGNNPAYALPVVERIYGGDIRIQLDGPEPSTLAFYRQVMGEDPDFTPYECQSVAPAPLSRKQKKHIQAITVAAFQALSCRDWARIDLRMDDQGRAFILDVNLEPTLTPEYALAKSAAAAGMSFTELVNRILAHAVERYPHLRQHTAAAQSVTS
jgi:D-alanine-D-alanine ligase-like ATP-grasp enzyme